MLRFIRIQNLAVIESIEVEFSPGFNVLTGETGAGKSIVADAVDLLLGAAPRRTWFAPARRRPPSRRRSRPPDGSWSSGARSPRRDAAARSWTGCWSPRRSCARRGRRAGGPARAARAAAAAGSRDTHLATLDQYRRAADCPRPRGGTLGGAAAAAGRVRPGVDGRARTRRAAGVAGVSDRRVRRGAAARGRGRDAACREAGAAARRPRAAALSRGLRSAGGAGGLGAEHARRRLEAGGRARADRRRLRAVRRWPARRWRTSSTSWAGRSGPPARRWRTPASVWPESRIGWPGSIG